MSWVAVAVVGGSVVGGIITGEAQKSAAEEASEPKEKTSENGKNCEKGKVRKV